MDDDDQSLREFFDGLWFSVSPMTDRRNDERQAGPGEGQAFESRTINSKMLGGRQTPF
jgi:hypothetical protein